MDSWKLVAHLHRLERLVQRESDAGTDQTSESATVRMEAGPHYCSLRDMYLN